MIDFSISLHDIDKNPSGKYQSCSVHVGEVIREGKAVQENSVLSSFNKNCCQDTVKSYRITTILAVLVLKRKTNISSHNQYHIFKAGVEVQVQGDISPLLYFHELWQA